MLCHYRSLKQPCVSATIILLMILVSQCNPRGSAGSPVAQALDQYFSHQFPADEPGGAVLLMNGDSVIFSKGYGLANMETKEPVTAGTLFNLGSISKTFVA